MYKLETRVLICKLIVTNTPHRKRVPPRRRVQRHRKIYPVHPVRAHENNDYLCSMDTKMRYWLDLSDYDLETASAMLTSGRYLYVGFMCHQTFA